MFLIGLAALAAPVIIHLLFRRRLAEIPFGTLRFLRMIDQKIMRRRRLEELLLLALRMLLIAALVFALARPVFKSAVFAGTGHASVVIVIDDSCSMRALSSGKSAFERGVSAALEIVSTLKPQDEVSVILASEASKSEAAFATDLEKIRLNLRGIRASCSRADLAEAAARARDVLNRAGNPMRELYVISDMQSIAWPEDAVKTLAEIPRTVPTVILDAGDAMEPNLAATGLAVPPRSTREGEPIRVDAMIRNFSDATARNSLALKSGEEVLSSCPVEAGPGAAMTYPMTLTRQTGKEWLLLEAKLGPDALDADNSHFLPLRFREKLKVLLINGSPSPVSYLDECFFLEAALRSGGIQGIGRIEPVKVSVADAERIKTLSDYAVVFMVNVPGPSPALAGALRDYARAGGGVFIFLGDQASPAVYNMLLGPAESDQTMLPAQIGPARTGGENRPDAAENAFEIIGSVKTGHPIFGGYAGEVDFGRLHYYRHMILTVPQSERNATLMALSGGDPILAEKSLGEGKVLLYAGSADTAWDNLPLKPIFLPMIMQTVQYLSSSQAAENSVTVGVPARICLAQNSEEGALLDSYAGEAIAIEGPPGERLEAKGERTGGAIFAEFPALPMPGFYTATLRVAGRNIERHIAANVDPAESDLRRADIAAITKAAPNCRIVRSGIDVAETARRKREGLPLWDWLLAAALLFAAAECYVANVVLKK